jgi:hypothetical protein
MVYFIYYMHCLQNAVAYFEMAVNYAHKMFMKLAPGCDPVCLVLELLRPEIVEILEQVGLQQLGVDPGDTVDRVRPDHCLKIN